jgi:hypothetical protein
MQGEGGQLARWWGGIKGALGTLQFIDSTGPKSLNGGEIIIDSSELGLRLNFGMNEADRNCRWKM